MNNDERKNFKDMLNQRMSAQFSSKINTKKDNNHDSKRNFEMSQINDNSNINNNNNSSEIKDRNITSNKNNIENIFKDIDKAKEISNDEIFKNIHKLSLANNNEETNTNSNYNNTNISVNNTHHTNIPNNINKEEYKELQHQIEENGNSQQTTTIPTISSSTNNKNDTIIKIFSGITEETIMIWESILLNSNNNLTCHLIHEDDDILSHESNNNKVIHNDVERTRVKDRELLHDFRFYLEKILSYYCFKNDLFYKQGLNEILAPFLLLKSNINISFSKIFNIYSCFIGRFLPNYYSEKDFFSLQSMLSLLNVLLRYHNSMLYYLLEYAMITPEMYATSWLLTFIASKLNLNIILALLDIIIQENDQIFILYFLVAFLCMNQNKIFEKDYSQIPSILSTLTITSIQEIHDIYFKACSIRDTTPFSFRLYIESIGVFSKKRKGLLDQTERLPIMPILASELLYLTFENDVYCPKENCSNFYLTTKNSNIQSNSCYYCNAVNNEKNKAVCLHQFRLSSQFKNDFETNNNNDSSQSDNEFDCFNVNNKIYQQRKRALSFNHNKLSFINKRNDINYLILDLRINDSELIEESNSGFIPKSISANQEDLNDENFGENFSDRFIQEKNNYHFIIITTETEHFAEYEEQFYRERINEKEKRQMMYNVQHRVTTVMRNTLVETSNNNKEKSFYIKLKEYDNFKQLVSCFIKKNFPKISYLHGGFKEIHKLCVSKNIKLVNHNEKKCYLCMNSIGSYNNNNNIKNKESGKHISENSGNSNEISTGNLVSVDNNELIRNKNNTIKNNNKITDNAYDELKVNNEKSFLDMINPFKFIKKVSKKDNKNIISKNSKTSNTDSNSKELIEEVDRNNAMFNNSITKLNDSNISGKIKEIEKENKILRKSTAQTVNTADTCNKTSNNTNNITDNSLKLAVNKQESSSILTFKTTIANKYSINNELKLQYQSIITTNVLKDIIESNQLTLFTCNYMKYKGSNNMLNIKQDSQIIIIMKESSLLLFYFNLINNTTIDTTNNNSKENIENTDNLSFVLFEVIEIKEILTIITKKVSKFIITLNYKSHFTKHLENLVLNFITDVDAKQFVSTVKKILEEDA